jgi:hypothetical protein
MYRGSAISVRAVENCPESAITAKPQTSASATTRAALWPNTRAVASALAPLTAIDGSSSPSVRRGRRRNL